MSERKTKNVLIKNSLRINENSLFDLRPKENIKVHILYSDTHLRDHPFTGISDVRLNFDEFKKEKISEFSSYLDKMNIQSEIVSTLPDVDFESDFLEGLYEGDFNANATIKHSNYLLDESILSELKSRMSFSYFRKRAESKAYRLTDENYDESSPGQQMIQQYFSLNAASSYFETRNALSGQYFSTQFSLLLNLGLVHPREILRALVEYENLHGVNKSTSWIKFELLWREYFYWLYVIHKEEFFQSKGLDGGTLGLSTISLSSYLDKMNINPLIKAMNNELITEGFLSNRSRQIYASFLIHNTDLDFRYGAWFFQLFLKDYDLYSNWGNWLYLSGHGTDSRGPRFFNITKQMKQYDPSLSYLKKYNPNISGDLWECIRND